MSAAIVQKSSSQTTTNTVAVYFGCGDIFNLNNCAENPHADHNTNHVNNIASKLSSVVGEERSIAMELKGKLEKSKENGNNCHYRYHHNALTRTASQPPQTLAQQGSNISTLVTPLIEDFGNINLQHRKLERTQSEPLPQQVNTSRYKTELCRPFEEAGECKYGEKCQFAHGYHELRNLQRHPKYKTEYCRTFHSVGFCPYGPRCHFVHNADEARASQQQQQQQQQQTAQHTKLTNNQQAAGTNFNNCLNTFGLPNVLGVGQQHQQQQQQQQQAQINSTNLGLPLSPPLSMSTGSDRESPTGSLSLSPANSITNFPFGDHMNHGNTLYQSNFSAYVNTPPESPNAPISPVNTPPPSILAAQLQYIKPITIPSKQLLHKSSSSPIAIAAKTTTLTNGGHKTLFKMNSVSSLNGGDEARLPVFNRLSSTLEKCPNMNMAL